MATKGILATVLLLLVGCGSDVSVSTTRNEPAVESSAETAPGTTSDKSSDTPPFAPEELGPTLAAYSRRLEARIDRAAGEIEMGEQTNQIRRNTLHWRIRTAEFVGESLGRSNAVVSMVELWYLTVSMQAFYDQGPGKAAFGSHQSIAQDTIRRLRTEAEGIVKRVLAPERFTKMKTEITGAVGRGELFAASQIEQGNILSDLLSVSHLQTLLSIPLAPFDALNGVSKGSDALHELAGVGARAVELAARYPRLLTWYIQLMSVEIQEQDAAKSALADLHSLSISAKELGDTAKELPVRMRVEATALLESSKDVQKTTQGTLERAQATADALDRAAHSLDLLVHSVDGFIATFRPQPGAPPAPAKPEKNQQPFDIRDYTAAIQATESSAREIRAAVESLNSVTSMPELEKRLHVVLGGTDASVEKVQVNLRDLVDRIALRTVQVSVLLAVLAMLVLGLHRIMYGKRHHPPVPPPTASAAAAAVQSDAPQPPQVTPPSG